MGKKRMAVKEKETPKVNKELNGFDIKINSFGEIVTSYDLDKINDFLDKNVSDKKLKNRSDFMSKRNVEGEEEGLEQAELDESDHEDLEDHQDFEPLDDTDKYVD